MHISYRRSLSLLLTSATLVAVGALPAHAQSSPPCFDETEETPEPWGPTDISATTGNQRLSAAVNPDATVTVLKWPSPSFYDQIKYRTLDRARPRLGARPNEGAFFGIAHRRKAGTDWKFSWLRSWPSRQRYADDDNDTIVTVFRRRGLGLKVKLTDVVRRDLDVMYRHVRVSRTGRSRVRSVRVIAFANFNPVVSKIPQSPTNDWCTEENNDAGGVYVKKRDAVVHERSGTDSSTGEDSSVALALGFVGKSNGHQVGTDSYAGNGEDGSAYDDAKDGVLSRKRRAEGQADAALADNINLRNKRAGSTTALLVASPTRKTTLNMLDETRFTGISKVTRLKNRWWRKWLRPAPLPRNAPRPVTRLAKRSLIAMRQVTDARRSMIVASIATQAPYGLDWIREGAYMNRALDMAGDRATVGAHNTRYGRLQTTAADPTPDGGQPIPPGNWAQNYYADGVAGGPIPYSIDETGYGIWTLWDHYVQTTATDYLLSAAVYEAIQRAAHYLTDSAPLGCKDPTNDLQCRANEGDNETTSQTLVGAQAVWLGLGSAAEAARVRGSDDALANADRWAARQEELGAAIEANFYDAECNCYTQDYETGGALLWPVGFEQYGSERSNAQAEVNFGHMTDIFGGEASRGRMESKMLLGNAYAWAGTNQIGRVKRGLKWVAKNPTTDRTGLLGEAWMRYPNEAGKITTMVSQPHAPSHAMFYLAALKAYGRTSYSFD